MNWNLLAAQDDMRAVLVIVFALIIITVIVLLFALVAKFFWLWIQSVTPGPKLVCWICSACGCVASI